MRAWWITGPAFGGSLVGCCNGHTVMMRHDLTTKKMEKNPYADGGPLHGGWAGSGKWFGPTPDVVSEREAQLRLDLNLPRSLCKTCEAVKLADAADGLIWPTGPVWLRGELLFTDAVEGSLWSWSEAAGLRRRRRSAGGCPAGSARLSRLEARLRERHTFCPEGHWELGPSSLAFDARSGLLASTQHGGRRVVRLRPSGELPVADVLASALRVNQTSGAALPDAVPLNSPHDVAVDALDGAFVFTDPYNGFVETTRRLDGWHEYIAAKSPLGFAGVYRVPPPRRVGSTDLTSDLQLITAQLSRPSGVQVEPPLEGGALWVSECCADSLTPSCPVGSARWHRFARREDAATGEWRNFTRVSTVEWRLPPAPQPRGIGPSVGLNLPKGTGRFEPPPPYPPPPEDGRHIRNVPTTAQLAAAERAAALRKPGHGTGCSDGFKLLPRPMGRNMLLVGACPHGVCVVDTGIAKPHIPSPITGYGDYRAATDSATGVGKVVEYIPLGEVYGGLRVTSVAFGGDGWLYVAGEGSLWRLQLSSYFAEAAAELVRAQSGAAGVRSGVKTEL